MSQALLSRTLAPLVDRASAEVPDHVAPNVLSLAGAALALQAWWISASRWPQTAHGPALVAVAALFSWLLSGIARRHAQRTRNDTPLTAVVHCACGLVSAIYLIATLCTLTLPSLRGKLVFPGPTWCIVQVILIVQLWRLHTASLRASGSGAFPIAVGSAELQLWARLRACCPCKASWAGTGSRNWF